MSAQYAHVSRRQEPVSKNGEILLSRNHICLLHGLYDRPGATAASTADWLRAALAHVRIFSDQPCAFNLHRSIGTMHPDWISSQRLSSRIVWWLMPRGLEILERRVPVRIRGHGPYVNLWSLRDEHSPARRPKVSVPAPAVGIPPEANDPAAVDAWWSSVEADPNLKWLMEDIRCMTQRWSTQALSRGTGDHQFYAVRRQSVRRYICQHVMQNRCLPHGEHDVPMPSSCEVRSVVVNFDDL